MEKTVILLVQCLATVSVLFTILSMGVKTYEDKVEYGKLLVMLENL